MADKNRCRLFMAEHIANHEPMSGDEIRDALGWRMQQFFDAVYGWPDRWFRLTINGWGLTEQGQMRLVESRRKRAPHSPRMESAIARAAEVEMKLDAWLLEHESSR